MVQFMWFDCQQYCFIQLLKMLKATELYDSLWTIMLFHLSSKPLVVQFMVNLQLCNIVKCIMILLQISNKLWLS